MARSDASTHVVVAALGLLCVPACALDDRTLEPLPPSGGGAGPDETLTSTGSGGTTGATTTTASSSGGNSNSSSTLGSTSSGAGQEASCPDLNQNRVPDCDETLVQNAAFDAGTEAWTAETQAELEWHGADSGGTSGTLSITHSGTSTGDRPTMAGSYQCLEVSPRSNYRFLAQSLIPAAQAGAHAALSALFYASNDCSGAPLDVVNSAVQSTPDTWRVLHAEAFTPEQAGSVKLRLVVVKAEDVAAAEIRFDNVLVLRE